MLLEDIQKAVTYLLDREAIRDVISSVSHGVDRLDRDQVVAMYHHDAVDDHGGYVGGREEFYDWVHEMHTTHFKLTQHYVANQIIEIADNTAHAETYHLFVGLNREGQPFSLMGGRYIDHLEKRDGRWAISQRVSLNEWAAPSINSVEAARTPEGRPNTRNFEPFRYELSRKQMRSARDRSDPSYIRPLKIEPERRQQFEEMMSSVKMTPGAGKDG